MSNVPLLGFNLENNNKKQEIETFDVVCYWHKIDSQNCINIVVLIYFKMSIF